MFGMLSVLAEYRRELIAANTRDGLAAARARGRKGGGPSKLSSDQIELAQRLYDAGDHTVAQIADMLKVPRTTVYGHLNKRRVDIAPVTQEITVVVDPPASTSRTCPTCGYEPTTRAEAAHRRADLAVAWLHADPDLAERLSADITVGIANPGNRHSALPAASAVAGPSSPTRSPSRRRTAT
ncbi:helix-turn-helix domain-containing protein [Rhodococcus opacus]|uniref:helix-turn-helix domain-containing protein n=1 Tax=Rhodococcus TaxID=1827 RepID=UPI0023F74D70|nr:helix-turn-helix domain-containing protein [Rhodococcus opacus]MDV6247990.1 helix-turn-helix domain-containing protein [Rhodococcus opacus]